MENEQIM